MSDTGTDTQSLSTPSDLEVAQARIEELETERGELKRTQNQLTYELKQRTGKVLDLERKVKELEADRARAAAREADLKTVLDDARDWQTRTLNHVRELERERDRAVDKVSLVQRLLNSGAIEESSGW